MTKIFLETVNLKKTFEHKNGIIELFNNVNLKVKKGELIALVGPSGSGKSSFLHLLALLDDPSKGKILLNNENVLNFDEDKASIKLYEEEQGISPGQACVFYIKNNFGYKVLGGGWVDL